MLGEGEEAYELPCSKMLSEKSLERLTEFAQMQYCTQVRLFEYHEFLPNGELSSFFR